jgi:hypothetical protein
MKNKKDFVKLFDLNVPSLEHFDYYIDQLSKTRKFSNIYKLIDLFELADKQIDDFLQYKVNKSNQIIEFIESTNTYTEMCYDNNLLDLPTNKSFHYEENVNYISIDLKSANWMSLKKYDQLNELGDSYADFLKRFDLPEVFIHSKYLRQFIFGNVNPKKQQKVQRNLTQEIVRKFSDTFKVECVKNDEVVFSFQNLEDLKLISVDESKWKIKFFNIQRVEDFRIDTIFDINGDILYKDLVGVNGQQFFFKLKQYVTNEPLDVKDLYFKQDGKLAIWMVDNLEVRI